MILDLETRAHVVNPRLTAYVYIDNRAAAGFAQALIPVVGFLADRKLGEGLRVTAEIAEWAIDRSGGFCEWLSFEPLARRDHILAVLPSCAEGLNPGRSRQPIQGSIHDGALRDGGP
jgi:hypothetical protein